MNANDEKQIAGKLDRASYHYITSVYLHYPPFHPNLVGRQCVVRIITMNNE